MKQAVIFIHGIGKQNAGFSQQCEDKIRKQLAKETNDDVLVQRKLENIQAGEVNKMAC